MQRLLPVTQPVLILDVIVDQGSLVKAFDRNGDIPDVLRKRRAGSLPQGLEDGHGEERPPSLASPGQPLPGERFGLAFRRTEQALKFFVLKPPVHLLTQRAEVEPARLVFTGQMDVIPYPVNVHVGIDAIVLEERDGHAGNGGRFHIGKGALEDAQATDADDCLNLSRLNQRHDDRGSFRDEDGIAQALGFGLQILNGAKAALFAEQAKLIKGRRTLAFHSQAFRKEEQAALKGNGGERFTPHLIIDQHADVIAVNGVASQHRHNAIGVPFKFLRGQWRNRHTFPHVLPHDMEDVIPLDLSLRNIGLGRTKTLHRNRLRDSQGRVLHSRQLSVSSWSCQGLTLVIIERRYGSGRA